MKLIEMASRIAERFPDMRYPNTRITHIPTGISVETIDKSRFKSVLNGLTILWARLVASRNAPPFHITRDYNLVHSYVRDFNGDIVSNDPQRVLDGDLDPIIDASYGAE